MEGAGPGSQETQSGAVDTQVAVIFLAIQGTPAKNRGNHKQDRSERANE